MDDFMRIGLTYTGTDWKHENYVRWLRADEDIEVVRLMNPAWVIEIEAVAAKTP